MLEQGTPAQEQTLGLEPAKAEPVRRLEPLRVSISRLQGSCKTARSALWETTSLLGQGGQSR